LTYPWYIEPEHRAMYDLWSEANKRKDEHALQLAATKLIAKCPAFLLHNYTKIQTKTSGLVLFNSWTPAQKRLYRVVRNLNRYNRPVRVVILKARQTGMSTLVEGLCYWATAFHPNVTSLIATQEDKAAERIFEMFRIYYATTPEPLRAPTDKFTLSEIRFGERDKDPGSLGLASRIFTHTVALGGSKKHESGKARGGTYHFFHGSECAFWPMPRRFMTGVLPGIPKTPNSYAFLESTANGTGNWFHNRWRRAAEGWRLIKNPEGGPPKWINEGGRSPFWVPVFMSWLEHPEYAMGLPSGASDPGNDKERRYYEKHINKEEYTLVEEFGATLEQIEWRRLVLEEDFEGDDEHFKQEFPATPEEAFITTGRKVFDMLAMRRYREMVMNVGPDDNFRGYIGADDDGHPFLSPDPRGPLKVYKKPTPGHLYTIGADSCDGVGSTGDYACAQVLDTASWEQVAVWHDRVDPDQFGEMIILLGKFYNEAFVVPEVNNHGQVVDNVLRRAMYWNRYRRIEYDKISGKRLTKFGFQTNTKTRSVLVGSLKAAVRKMQLGLNDSETIEEMEGWERKRDNRGNWKEEPGDEDGYDDRIMALGMALQGGVLDNPLTGVETDESVDDDIVESTPSIRKRAYMESSRGVSAGMYEW
jgi:hypothetical protein